jgi:Leucine-rich repeat (LRR) protein
MRKLFVLLTLLFSLTSIAQELSKTEISDFKAQGNDLISYLEFTLNSIGDTELSAKEKDIMISESFLKMFRDAKVQVEDDLDVRRETVTNKDVQAYLKDVDFFFRNASFTFNILSVSIQTDEKGKPFLLANVLRTLKAVDLKGDTFKNDQQRFIEISIDSDKRDLKIASIYTTKLNENEENMRWWNLLPTAWKSILGRRALLSDSISFSSVVQITPNYVLLNSRPSANPAEETRMEAAAIKYDTLWVNDKKNKTQREAVFAALNQILEITDLNISGETEIFDLEPVSKLSNLRTLDVSSTQIENIYPARNLIKLQNLNCSNTAISALDALVFSMNITVLNIANTAVSSISSLANLTNLKILTISNAPIEEISACSEMNQLEDLRMRNTRITDLSPLLNLSSLNYMDLSDNEQLYSLDALKELKHLKVLYCNNTQINDLKPLASLENLETLYCENSEITSLDGLQNLKNLKKVYCDNSMLGRQKAVEFMKNHPSVLVVYESKQLQMWWDELSDAWKNVFSQIVKLDKNLTKEQLHQITTIKEINISGNKEIYSLVPLEKLKYLQKLNASSTAITSIDGIGEAREMQKLDLSHNAISQVYALENLNLIEELSLANCPIDNLKPLQGLINLKKLDISTTEITDLSALEKLNSLHYLNADNTKINPQAFIDFGESKKDILILYKSKELQSWWENLSFDWKEIFRTAQMWTTQTPNYDELHRLIRMESIEIKDNRAIENLVPLEELQHLRKLKINDTKINDVSPLANLHFLQELDLSRNPIMDLLPLQGLKNLEYIYLNNTPVKTLLWTLHLSKLRILDISGTGIKSIKELSNAVHLEKLIAYNTKISSIKPLEGLPNLILLKIYNSNISPKKVDVFKLKYPDCAIDFY